MLKLYNSLSQQKEVFTPLKANRVSLYACGMTVYDYCHIGHARALIVFDSFVRFLRYSDYTVNYVRNITDIDDKIIKRALENNESCDALTARFIDAMHEDEAALGNFSPDHEPRATDYMAAIIALIETIIAQGFAYVSADGDVCFDLSKSRDYGKLSKRDIDQLIAGARVDAAHAKRNPLDFVLWKKAKSGEPAWDSPWGKGRPGWHIECSAMSTELLGQPFDIHGGGMDLKFPHHENEIAQSEAACGKEFAKLWMHVGLLNVEGEKMSKSLGNFFTIREVLEQYDHEVIRLFMLSSSYRSPVNYSKETLHGMSNSLERLYTSLRGLPKHAPVENSDFEKQFTSAMNDDFNTPEALAVLFELSHEINRLKPSDIDQAAAHAALLVKLAYIIGIAQQAPDAYLQGTVSVDEAALIKTLIEQRQVARQEKNFTRGDEIRDQLQAMGIAIDDSKGETTWRRL